MKGFAIWTQELCFSVLDGMRLWATNASKAIIAYLDDVLGEVVNG